jgi:hypothetical protein
MAAEPPWRNKSWAEAADRANQGLNGQGYVVHSTMLAARAATWLTCAIIALIVVQIIVAVWPTWRGVVPESTRAVTGWPWAATFSLLGLLADICGATILVYGLLQRDMAVFRDVRDTLEDEGAMPRTWHRMLPLRIAFRFGSEDVSTTSPGHLEEYIANFWGLTMLILGFVSQAIGAAIGAWR